MARNKSTFELYRRGVPLADAAFHFAPEELLRSHQWASIRWTAKVAASNLQLITTLRSPSVSDSTKASIAAQLNIDLRNPPSAPFCDRDPNKYRHVFLSDRARPEDYERLFERELVRHIRDGKYIMIGIELPRTSKSKPARIPEDVFQSSFSVGWKDSVLVGNGLEFVAVRVIAKSSVQAADAGAAKGRTSRKPEIQITYRELRRGEKIKLGDAPKTVTDAIRRAIVRNQADDWGLHHATIWRHVRSQHRRRTK